jgi:hypothetical protein
MVIALIAMFNVSYETTLSDRCSWGEYLVWLILFPTLDYRFSNRIWLGPGSFSYVYWAVLLNCVLVLSYTVFRGVPLVGFAYDFTFRSWQQVVWMLLTFVVWGCVYSFFLRSSFGDGNCHCFEVRSRLASGWRPAF